MDIMQSLERLHRECIYNSSDEESDEMSQFMVAAAFILHKAHEKQMPVYRGSTKGHQGKMPRNRVGGHAWLYKNDFHLTDHVYNRTCSGSGTGCQETCLWSFYGASEITTPTSNTGPMPLVS
jgi:hypothetical protein